MIGNIFKATFKQILKRNCSNITFKQVQQNDFTKILSFSRIPKYKFSRFGSVEKKIEDLTKQLNQYSRKNNYKQMVMTQIRIIKLKEKKESKEFYPNFVVDYKQLCDFLIKQRDFEEAITLYQDCINYFTEISCKDQKEVNQEGESHENSLSENISELISLKLELANVFLIDPSKNGDEAFELIEDLKENLKKGQLNRIQRLKLILQESRLYYKTYEIKESLETILQADQIINEQIEEHVKQLDYDSLLVEILTQKLKILVELQDINAAEIVIKQCEDLIHKNDLKNKNIFICIEFYHACLESQEYIADFDKAQSLTIEIEQLLENSENQDPAYQANIYYYDSLVMNQIGNYIQSVHSLSSCFNSLEKAINIDNSIVWKALKLKAILMIQENDFQNGMKILITIKQEMEKHNVIKTRFYYEILVHIAIMRYSLTQLDQATNLSNQLVERVCKNFGQSSDLYYDGLLIQGLCLISDNKLTEENKLQGLINIRQACMGIKSTKAKQLYIRVVCLQLLKEVLKKKQQFKEIFYINTVLDSQYFQPRLKTKQSKEFLNQYQDNCKQLELISNILNLGTINNH